VDNTSSIFVVGILLLATGSNAALAALCWAHMRIAARDRENAEAERLRSQDVILRLAHRPDAVSASGLGAPPARDDFERAEDAYDESPVGEGLPPMWLPPNRNSRRGNGVA